MYFHNLFVAAATFAIIGIFHPIVIKTEYYIGTRAWPAFAAAGCIFLVASVLTGGTAGILFAVTGCSWFWGIKELFDQKKRVDKGWFPRREDKNAETSNLCTDRLAS